jgi:hypothetical protein
MSPTGAPVNSASSSGLVICSNCSMSYAIFASYRPPLEITLVDDELPSEIACLCA